MVRVTALSLNMQNGQVWDPDRPDDAPVVLERAIDFLKEQDADLFFLQEVEFPDSEFPDKRKHPNYDGLRAAFPRYNSCFAYPSATRGHLPFGIGLAIFSRFRLHNCFHMVLPASDVEFAFRGRHWLPAERSLIGAEIEISGKRISLLDTHLQAYFMIESSADRNPAQREIVTTVLRGRKLPTLLGGDFNCTPQEGTLASIEAAGMKTLQKDIITWHRMPLVLDHIFYSPEFRVESFEVVKTDASDHDAIKGTFVLE